MLLCAVPCCALPSGPVVSRMPPPIWLERRRACLACVWGSTCIAINENTSTNQCQCLQQFGGPSLRPYSFAPTLCIALQNHGALRSHGVERDVVIMNENMLTLYSTFYGMFSFKSLHVHSVRTLDMQGLDRQDAAGRPA